MYFQKTVDQNTFEEVEPPRKPLSLLQKWAVVLIPSAALTAWCLIYIWASSNDTDEKFMGGLNWNDKVAQWHFVAMTAFFFFASLGMSAYRFLPLGKLRNKILHGIWHTFGIISFGVGLGAMFKSHNDNNMPNLWSAHSWIGIMCVSMYAQNYVGGFLTFATSAFNPEFKAWYLQYHRAFGDVAYVFLIGAIISGITEQNAFNGCYGNIDTEGKPDYNPAAHYTQMYKGCRVSNGAAVCIAVTALLVFMVGKNMLKEKEAHPDNAPLLN